MMQRQSVISLVEDCLQNIFVQNFLPSLEKIANAMKSMWWKRYDPLSQSEHLLLTRRRSRDEDKFEMCANHALRILANCKC